MKPVTELPPGTPLTLQVTLELVVPLTAALRLCDAPKSTDAVAGDTVTLTEEGVGGGGAGVTEPASPPAHPAPKADSAKRVEISPAENCGGAAERD